ncbi:MULTISPECIES: hypothetical protein [Aneurinibacillus]|jgi:hypothetical protein|uniref:Uncharacterized protein n=1 Tax=Aneurinibacillus danicus TaxID=267746 RepID=A0A511VFI6_9BACL|nr:MULTISPECIES: hypothetical protein [Aneurinibacillus]GEN36323.1 hypothetical protein ADA01nite_37830 [Aneurinibacillus danicus]
MCLLQKQLRTRLNNGVPRLSFYRMMKSAEFDELCRFYTQDMLTFEQLERRVRCLERLF